MQLMNCNCWTVVAWQDLPLILALKNREKNKEKHNYCEVVLTLIETVSFFRGNEVINQIQTAVTADHHPCGAVLHLHGSWLQRQWLAQCQWHFKTYFLLALVLLLWKQSSPLAASVGTHSSTPAVPFLNDPLHLLCSTLNTAWLIPAPSIQTSSHWHFVPARDFSRWHFTQKKASMS